MNRKIEKLVFVTKFNNLCFDAVQSLMNLRHAHLNHIVFLNVIEKELVSMKRGKGYDKEEEVRLKEKANIRFIDWAEKLFEEGMEVGAYITVGNLVPEVIQTVKNEEADLIVIGRSHKGVFEQLYSGSDVAELVRRVKTPILVYKHKPQDIEYYGKPFEHPLLAMDWSPASFKAVEYLKNLKNVVKEVDVINVTDEKSLKGSSMAIQKTRKEIRMKLDEISDSLEDVGIRANSHVYVGEPVEEIEKAVRECRATMIVMGSSSKSAIVERWIGSVPRDIADKSPYSALIIPPDGKK